MIEIRKASISDIPFIKSIAEETWPITFGNILNESQIRYMLDWMYSTETLQQQIETENHQFLVAQTRAGDSVLGFAGIQHGIENELTKIHKLYIRPKAQGMGVGRRMMDQITELAHEQGDYGIFLNVNKYNTQAIDFYQYLGFIKVSEEVIDIGNGYVMDDYVMQLSLNR
ncbi:GNAT family N-acetyltransferase [Mongoliitalea daihaiensis]|uniref:GNAT family N-acetyltransferase n=1 Tax=Mongoliitalea daihaiensis TaxID=2782006 RepID=UPI001F3C8F03|nr:GNAT family N-acetyltransferase [Mongoliitalea daihaiensis]UJP63935.1 GNAT family N-acetyltransferase [Mongoliitalea daihaiensis]